MNILGGGTMIIYRFDQEVGRAIGAYDSTNLIMSRIIASEKSGSFHIGCIYLGTNGKVGYHQTATNQLFLVVQGEGWVRSGDHHKMNIKAGQAAFWIAGEWHESGTESGMMAIVIESDSLDPIKLPEVLI
jgi:quercetin dioxygenase-like cupin family protein